MQDWLSKVVHQLQDPAWAAGLLSSAASTVVGVVVAVWALRRQLRHDSAARRAERNTVLVEPLARALRADSRSFAEMFGDFSVLKFSGMGLEPGRRRGYPGLEVLLEAMDSAKPSLPFPSAVMTLIADREDRWAVLRWAHLVRREAFPVRDSMKDLVGGLSLLGLDEDGRPCKTLLYNEALPAIQRRVLGPSVEREEELGLMLHRWDGEEPPPGWEPLPGGPDPLAGAQLRKLIEEIVGVFNEEESRVRNRPSSSA